MQLSLAMILKPQDILFLLKLVSMAGKPWVYNSLALDLGISPSELHAAAKRALKARLAIEQNDILKPHISNLKRFLQDGIQFVFIPEMGELTRGIPTSYAAEPMRSEFIKDSDPPPVWPDPDGKVRGMSFSPLYKSVPFAVKKDKQLYELLVLVDAIRGGRARERNFASKALNRQLDLYESES